MFIFLLQKAQFFQKLRNQKNNRYLIMFFSYQQFFQLLTRSVYFEKYFPELKLHNKKNEFRSITLQRYELSHTVTFWSRQMPFNCNLRPLIIYE